MSRLDWPYLIAPAFVCVRFHWRSSVRVLTGAVGPSDASHLLKSRFIPYLKETEQSASLPLASLQPEQMFHDRQLFFASLSTTLGMSAVSTITAPRCFRTSIASAITFAWSALMPPRGSLPPGGVTL